ncbi:hypothetical protein MKO06_11335 [Gramella sp. GC03-9]|uniref:Lipocalin-like domain-containing protein n=1 Tax=Christiangramia oceanisediminis TaxID=2920386 RepID=A0A9X2KYN5_9FLAO|nr:hypothetical protein [Gramella oceanisediminis]MCP9200506.1 hypothetical protein [Gramella oceanisediminis]
MKRLKFLLVLFCLSLFISCDKDNDDLDKPVLEARELNRIIMDGEWRVSEFEIDGSDETARFEDYTFVFETNNNLSANSSLDNLVGSWRVNIDSGGEFDSFDDVDFHIFFEPSAKLAELSHNYNVISATDKLVNLELEGPQDGPSLFVSFSKN